MGDPLEAYVYPGAPHNSPSLEAGLHALGSALEQWSTGDLLRPDPPGPR
ncbi:MAG: hypothetical protein ACRBN8_03820 [Nannocystales bacterium]